MTPLNLHSVDILGLIVLAALAGLHIEQWLRDRRDR